MKFIITLSSLFFSLTVLGQSTPLPPASSKTGLSVFELKVACDEFKRMMTTDTYVLHEKKTKAFAKKMGTLFLEAPADFYNVEVFYPWLEKNIARTQFTSMKEAKAELEEMGAIYNKMTEENKQLYDFLSRATVDQITAIRKPMSRL